MGVGGTDGTDGTDGDSYANAPREAGAVAPSLHADVRGEVSDG